MSERVLVLSEGVVNITIDYDDVDLEYKVNDDATVDVCCPPRWALPRMSIEDVGRLIRMLNQAKSEAEEVREQLSRLQDFSDLDLRRYIARCWAIDRANEPAYHRVEHLVELYLGEKYMNVSEWTREQLVEHVLGMNEDVESARKRITETLKAIV